MEPKSSCPIGKRGYILSSKNPLHYLILTALVIEPNLSCHFKSFRENKLPSAGERLGIACSLSSPDILLSKFLTDFLLMSVKLT